MNKWVMPIIVSSLCYGTAVASEWGYSDTNGPEHWGKVSKTCVEGQSQSPINIQGNPRAMQKSLSVEYLGSVESLVNNGHTLQANVTGNNRVLLDGKAYSLKQFHFHTPAENLIRSRRYPLEAHFVNQDERGNLLVVAVMFKNGNNNLALQHLTNTLPTKGGQTPITAGLKVAELIPDTSKYFQFNGSLTTPPCSEGVKWVILKQSKSLSEEQNMRLKKVMGNNNRPIQSINKRVVFEMN
ncbi:carbonic anhydrase [Vibrio sp. CAIM 722]|uniref:carbonic anhydrase n=1 Tax=Vibrio eleionomae TaxID=2653505 RepID=A0A7X4LPR7_9VIBR|nr:carbonic anhydrase family protein [Vibrio eleionomae]MZI95837.1 carbonic anhydrase [Vibrio eleionomae]